MIESTFTIYRLTTWNSWQMGNTGPVEKTMGWDIGEELYQLQALLWPHFSLNNFFIVWRHRRMGNWDEKFFFVKWERERREAGLPDPIK